MSLPIDLSTPEKEGTLQVSKARTIPILLDENEMEALFKELKPFSIFNVSQPVTLESAQISPQLFLEQYALYVQGIRKGSLIDEKNLRAFFSAVFTASPDLLYAMPLKNGKYLIKARCPVIQLRRHHFIFSDGFYSGIIGEKSLTWGIQFSYPQLFLETKTGKIGKVEKNDRFPNTALFHRLTKWVRDHTSVTPFCMKEKQMNQPIRLGKKCFSWINNHQGLKERGLYVASRKYPSSSH